MARALTLVRGAAFGVLALTLGCNDDDDDAVPAGGTVDGSYTLSVTARENECGLDDWTTGQSSSGIRLELEESEGDVTGRFTGRGAALVLIAAFGPDGNTLKGKADGGQVDLSRRGTTAFSEGDCTFTFNVTLEAEVDGDTIAGNLIYTIATNDNPDCEGLEGCFSRQEFNGTRPPE